MHHKIHPLEVHNDSNSNYRVGQPSPHSSFRIFPSPQKCPQPHLQSISTSTAPRPRKPLTCFLQICLFCTFHVYGIIQHIVFCIWLLLRSTMFLRFFHLAALIRISLSNNILSYACSTFSLSILQMIDIWIASNLGLLRINAAMNNCIQFFVWTVFTSREYVPESNRMIHFTFEETTKLFSQSGFHHMSPAE